MEHTVLSVASRALIKACDVLGLPTDELLRQSGISLSRLNDPDAMIPAQAADRLWEAAYRVSGDPLLSLHAVEALPFGAYRVIDYLAGTAPTVGSGLTNVLRYFPLIDSRVRWQVSDIEGHRRLGFESVVPGVSIPAPAQEYTFAAILLRSREGTGIPWTPSSIHFTFPKPKEMDEYSRIFGTSLHFNAPDAAMIIAHQTWNTPSDRADSSLYAVLKDHARRLSAERRPPEQSLSEKVGEQIRRALVQGVPSMNHIAKSMGLSAKTLQRRLKEEQKTFAELLEGVRHKEAEHYLSDPTIALAEVAFLTGFSEQSAFTRAFKRWTGESPKNRRSTLISS